MDNKSAKRAFSGFVTAGVERQNGLNSIDVCQDITTMGNSISVVPIRIAYGQVGLCIKDPLVYSQALVAI